MGWNEPRAFFSNAGSVLHPTFDFVEPRQPPCPLQGWPIVSVCLNQAGNGKLAGKGASALQAALMVGPSEAGQESTYKLTFLTMRPGPRATLDKHCHMVMQLPESQPMGPVSVSHMGSLGFQHTAQPRGQLTPLCHVCWF